MKKIVSGVSLLLAACTLWGASYEELMTQAEQLAKARKYQDAAAAFDDASLETDSSRQRIEARYRGWECLSKARANNAVSTAETLLYDEPELSSDRKVELISYIAQYRNIERRKRAIEFGLNLQGLNEKQRSRILLAALQSGGSWNSEAYGNEILAMKHPDPEAKAHALGHRANIFLWVKRDPRSALKCINETLAVKELSGGDRQFFTLVQARAYVALKQFKMAEQSYLAALAIDRQDNFQEAAYQELTRVYIISKQPMKIEPLLKRAAADKGMNQSQRQVFANLLAEIDKARSKQKQ